jgi:hypothetical protein
MQQVKNQSPTRSEQPNPGDSRPPARICIKCRIAFRPRLKATATTCENCQHGRKSRRVYEGWCEVCRRRFHAPTAARKQCENCRLEKSRRSRNWQEPTPRSYQFEGVGSLAGEKNFSVTVNAGSAQPIEAREGIIETDDAEVAKALSALEGLRPIS